MGVLSSKNLTLKKISSSIMDIGSLLQPSNLSATKFYTEEAKALIVRNLEILESEVKKINSYEKRLGEDEKIFLEKILHELTILRQQITFLDPIEVKEEYE
jgi:hypothetical protein